MEIGLVDLCIEDFVSVLACTIHLDETKAIIIFQAP